MICDGIPRTDDINKLSIYCEHVTWIEKEGKIASPIAHGCTAEQHASVDDETCCAELKRRKITVNITSPRPPKKKERYNRLNETHRILTEIGCWW